MTHFFVQELSKVSKSSAEDDGHCGWYKVFDDIGASLN